MTDPNNHKAGASHGGGLGGNRISQERAGSSVNESDLSEGERRRGGQSPEPKESAYATNE